MIGLKFRERVSKKYLKAKADYMWLKYLYERIEPHETVTKRKLRMHRVIWEVDTSMYKRKESPFVEVSGEFMYESPAAVLLRIDGDDDREQWIPKSLIEDWDEDACPPGAAVDINVREWFALKEGLI